MDDLESKANFTFTLTLFPTQKLQYNRKQRETPTLKCQSLPPAPKIL